MTPDDVDDDDHLTDADHLTNPSGRLLLLLRSVRIDANASTQQKPIPVRTLVASYLGVDEEDNPAYFAAYAGLVQLPVQARAQIDALRTPPIPRRTLSRPFDDVEKLLAQAATARVRAHDFVNNLNGGVLNDLEATSAILRHVNQARVVDDAELERIRTLATDIIDSLAGSDLPPNVRADIHLHAAKIIAAANAYKVHGADVLFAEADGLTGAAVRNAPLIPGFLGNPIVQKISALANLIVATTTILGVPNALVGGFEFIGELTSTPVVLTETPAQHGDPRDA